MRLSKPASISLLLILYILGQPALSGGQPPEPAAPTLKVYSRETVVDVTVTDAKGNPVHGLKQSDFTVKEDGKPQPIRSFSEHTIQPAPASPKLPANVHTNLQAPPTSDAINFLWLDFTNIAPAVPPEVSNDPSIIGTLSGSLGVQHRAKQATKQYLHDMAPGTRVAVLGTSFPANLRVLQGVTTDPDLLSAAIDSLDYDTDAMAFNQASWCAQQDRRNRATLEALNQIAASLAQIKGRKNLLWYTMRIRTLVDQHPNPCLTNLFDEVQRAYGLLAAAQVTVYPISVRGVEENSTEKAQDNLGLETVAEATGGKAYYNSNDLAGLTAKAIDTGSDYYTLSYVPPGTQYDGRHHTIKLQADQPNLHLTYRDEYYAEDPSKMTPPPGLTLTTTPPDAQAGNMRAAMSRNMPISTQLLFDVQVEPSATPPTPADTDSPILGTLDPAFKAKLKGKPLTRYEFAYSIPAKQITFASVPSNTHRGSLELDLAAYDDQGKLITGLSQTVNMPLSDAKYQQFIKGPFRFAQQLDLPSGQLFLRIGIYDPASNKVGTLEIPLTIPKK